jgi:hypothetical protein
VASNWVVDGIGIVVVVVDGTVVVVVDVGCFVGQVQGQ